MDDYGSSRYGALIMDPTNSSTGENRYLVLANGSAYHAWPTFANFANQAILQQVTSSSIAYLRVRIEPLSETNNEKADSERVNGVILVYFLILGFSIVPAVFVYSVVVEKTGKSKHMQLISGVNT